MPEMTAAEYAGLVESIKANGQRRPIMLFEGKILDGRHRYRACLELRITPIIKEFKGDYAAAVQFVMDEAMHRHMAEGQKAVAAEAFMDDMVLTGTKVGTEKRKASEVAALRFGVARSYVEEVRQYRKSAPEIYGELFAGRLNPGQARNRFKQKARQANAKKVHRRAASAGVVADHEVRIGDNLQLMELMPANSVAMVFTDLPYNNGWKYHNDPTRDQLHPAKYVEWCAKVIAECRRLLTDEGSIFVLVDDNYSDHIGLAMRGVGLHRQSTIVWWETFANHNSAETGLTCRTRYIHYYTKRPDGFTFNTDVRVPSARLAVYKDPRANPTGMVPSNVWQVSRKQGTAIDRVPFADAPPQIPVEVIERCILLASNPGDLIFDPCVGNGTTAVAAGLNGRRSLGCERSPKYAKQARQWIASQLANAGAK